MNTLTPYVAALIPPGWPAWLENTRKSALAGFVAQGLPGAREEAWKYTALGYLETTPLHAPESASTPSAATETSDYPGQLLAFVNGELAVRNTPLLPAGLADSLAGSAETLVVRRYLAKLAGRATLTRLNTALWRDGALIHVPSATRIETPIFLSFSAAEADAMLHPRNLVVLEAGAEAVLVEHYGNALEAAYWHNAVTEIVLKKGARLTHLKLTEEGSNATHTALTAVLQEHDSSYRSLSVSCGGRVARHDLSVSLQGAGANARLDGLFIADGRRHVDHHLRVEHLAPHTTSRETYRGMAAGRGRGVFDGRVVVRPGGQHSDALLSSRNLLLSPDAEIDAKPQLEIYTDEVKCGHGVSVGQLDEAQLFYLRSRGIAADAAYALLLKAFADEALGLLDETGLRAWLEPRLLNSLPAPAGKHPGAE